MTEQVQAPEIPYGYCQCGCGEKTRLAPKTSARKGWRKGEPQRFLHGHHFRAPGFGHHLRTPGFKGRGFTGAVPGEKNHQWKGDAVSPVALRHWLNANFPKSGRCDFCKKKGKAASSTTYVSISGEYSRDIKDYIELCRSCHKSEQYKKFDLQKEKAE